MADITSHISTDHQSVIRQTRRVLDNRALATKPALWDSYRTALRPDALPAAITEQANQASNEQPPQNRQDTLDNWWQSLAVTVKFAADKTHPFRTIRGLYSSRPVQMREDPDAVAIAHDRLYTAERAATVAHAAIVEDRDLADAESPRLRPLEVLRALHCARQLARRAAASSEIAEVTARRHDRLRSNLRAMIDRILGGYKWSHRSSNRLLPTRSTGSRPIQKVTLTVFTTRILPAAAIEFYMAGVFVGRTSTALSQFGDCPPFPNYRGLPQGGVECPLLWREFYDPVLCAADEMCTGVTLHGSYVTDVRTGDVHSERVGMVGLAYVDDATWFAASTQDMTRLLALLDGFNHVNNIKTNASKGAMMSLNAPTSDATHVCRSNVKVIPR
ncbi:hypothetical protein RI367_001581 [Sorochytrium milnesiophthora]